MLRHSSVRRGTARQSRRWHAALRDAHADYFAIREDDVLGAVWTARANARAMSWLVSRAAQSAMPPSTGAVDRRRPGHWRDDRLLRPHSSASCSLFTLFQPVSWAEELIQSARRLDHPAPCQLCANGPRNPMPPAASMKRSAISKWARQLSSGVMPISRSASRQRWHRVPPEGRNLRRCAAMVRQTYRQNFTPYSPAHAAGVVADQCRAYDQAMSVADGLLAAAMLPSNPISKHWRCTRMPRPTATLIPP